MPVSGFSGVNVVDPDYSKHPFYKGPSLIKYLDDLPLIKRESGAPVRFCVSKIILQGGVTERPAHGWCRKVQVFAYPPCRKTQVFFCTLMCLKGQSFLLLKQKAKPNGG